MKIKDKYVAKALRFISEPTSPSDNSVVAELVPTIVLLNHIPDTQRIGDYLLDGPVHRAEESVFARLDDDLSSRTPDICIHDLSGAFSLA